MQPVAKGTSLEMEQAPETFVCEQPVAKGTSPKMENANETYVCACFAEVSWTQMLPAEGPVMVARRHAYSLAVAGFSFQVELEVNVPLRVVGVCAFFLAM